MKKSRLFFLALISISLFIGACSKEDDTEENQPSTSVDFPGVPSGEIVAIAQREAALTGNDGKKSTNEALKYWSFAESKAFISGCGLNQEIDMLDQLGYTSDTQLAFGTNGTLYVKSNGNVLQSGGWKWNNSTTKDGIILTANPDIIFTFTVLNENEVVYASKQTGAYESCNSTTIITYERMVYSSSSPTNSNHFKIGNSEYEIGSAALIEFGEDLDPNDGWNYDGVNLDLMFFSEGLSLFTNNDGDLDVSGQGAILYFESFSDVANRLSSGTYSYTSEDAHIPVSTFDFAYYELEFNVNDTISEEVFIRSGYYTVELTNDTYEININCKDENGNDVSGYYKGLLDFFISEDDSSKQYDLKEILSKSKK